MLNLSRLDELIAKFELVREQITSEAREMERLRQKFVTDFPRINILDLTLDQYVVGKRTRETYCNRVENELNAWGNIHGSPAKKFGIYYGIAGKDKTRTYRVGKRSFGGNIEEAFYNVKREIVELLNAGDNEDFVKMKSNRISPMFKGKLLSLYFPEKFLNIFASSHLDHFLKNLEIENNTRSELDKQQLLLGFKDADPAMAGWSIFEFSKFLYSSFGIPPKNSVSGPNPLNPEIEDILDFPLLESVVPELLAYPLRSIKEIIEKTSPKKKRNRPSKIDYTNKLKRAQDVGSRGEEIALKFEIDHLRKAGREDLAAKVERVSSKDDSLGYDIRTFDLNGKEKYVEVKSTTRGIGQNEFFITENELSVSRNSSNYYFYLVFHVNTTAPKILRFRAVELFEEGKTILSPILYHVRYSVELP